MLKSHLLNHIVEDSEKLGDVHVLSSSSLNDTLFTSKVPFAQHRDKSKRGWEETVGVIQDCQISQIASSERTCLVSLRSIVKRRNSTLRTRLFIVREGLETR